MVYLVAALGGVLGALARWGVTLALPFSPARWPWATLLVNVVGCLLIGVVLAVLPVRFPTVAWLRPFLAVGVLGGFTTYSTFAVEAVRLTEAGRWPVAVAYVVVSVLGGIVAVVAGLVAARAVVGREVPVAEELLEGEEET